jgi:putative mRNA 3-end processing factor
VLYTGDYKSEDTLLHKAAKQVPDVDVLITESTYADRDHPSRSEVLDNLRKETQRVLESGGTALFPCFAIGRSQELACIFSDFDCDVYMDGMAKSASQIMLSHPSYVANNEMFQESLNKLTMVESTSQRRIALKKPSIIITTAGMLDGGPVLSYIPELNKSSEIFLTGYQVEGTNGRLLVTEKKIRLSGRMYDVTNPVHHVDLSAHAGRTELFEFVKNAKPSKIFCLHGDADNCKKFADDLKKQGFDAVAPAMGDSFEIK